jgi:hypothetical protein
MPVTISQIRPEGLQAAVDFAKTTGCTAEPDTVDPQVSLIAQDGETIIAAVLSVRTAGRSCELNVCLSKVDDVDQLIGELINKALMKVNGAGIRRCRISHHGLDNLPSHWPSANWTDQDDATAEAEAEPEPESKTVVESDAEPEIKTDAGTDTEAA